MSSPVKVLNVRVDVLHLFNRGLKLWEVQHDVAQMKVSVHYFDLTQVPKANGYLVHDFLCFNLLEWLFAVNKD